MTYTDRDAVGLGAASRDLASRRQMISADMAVLGAIVALGAAIRIEIYSRGASLWIDEARLALSLGRRSFAGLAAPLAYDQSAPLLFLWVQKAVITLWGVNEYALRLFPLIAGIATVAVVYFVGRRVGGRLAAAIAALLAAVSPNMVKFAIDNKQYSVEALATGVILLTYLAWLEQPSERRARTLLWTGVAAVWFSAPAVFVLAPLGMVGLLRESTHTQSARRWLARACACWAASFAAAYLLTYGHAEASSYMGRYWEPAFLIPVGGDLWLRLRGAGDAVLWSILVGREPLRPDDPGSVVFVFAVTALVVCAMVAGISLASKYRDGIGAWILLTPVILASGASFLGAYPLVPRTALFMAPLLYVLVGLGLDGMLKARWGRLGLVVGMTSAAALVLCPVTLVVRELSRPMFREHVRPLIARLRAERGSADVTYVSPGALPTYAFYTTDWDAPDQSRLALFERLGHSNGPAFQNAPSRGRAVGPAEGQTLVWRGREGLEMIGIPTGIETDAVGVIGDAPDPGWAEHEAKRILAAMGSGDAWILLSFMHHSELALTDYLQKAGLHITLFPSGSTSVLIHAAR